MSFFAEVERNTEKKLCLSLDEIRDFSPENLREYLEKKHNKKLDFITEYPTIGRGNVLRDTLISRDRINEDIDTILMRQSK